MNLPREVLTNIFEYLDFPDFLTCHLLNVEMYEYLTKTFNVYRLWADYFKSYFLADSPMLDNFKKDYNRLKEGDLTHWKRLFIEYYRIRHSMKEISTYNGNEDGFTGEIWDICVRKVKNGYLCHICGEWKRSVLWDFDPEIGELKKLCTLLPSDTPFEGSCSSSSMSYDDDPFILVRKDSSEFVIFHVPSTREDQMYQHFAADNTTDNQAILPTFLDHRDCIVANGNGIEDSPKINLERYDILRLYREEEVKKKKKKCDVVCTLILRNSSRMNEIRRKLDFYTSDSFYRHTFCCFERTKEGVRLGFLNWSEELFSMYGTRRGICSYLYVDRIYYITIPFDYDKDFEDTGRHGVIDKRMDCEEDTIWMNIEILQYHFMDMLMKDGKIYVNSRSFTFENFEGKDYVTGINQDLFVQVFSVETRERLFSVKNEPYSLGLRYNANYVLRIGVFDKYLVCGTDDGQIMVIDQDYGIVILKVEAHEKLVNCVRGVRDSGFISLISGSDDGRVSIRRCKI